MTGLDEARLTELAGPAPAMRPSGRLAGKVCLVTGGGTGIGRAAALRCALEAAAAVVIGGRRAEAGEAAAAAVQAAGAAELFVPADVTQADDVARLVGAAVARFGRLDEG